jgi:hypothetical protein
VAKSTCEEDDCDVHVHANGRCKKHHRWWLRAGNQFVRPTPEERFWAKVDKSGPVPPERPDLGNCWLWTGSQNRDGYGQVNRQGKTLGAHRVGYELQGDPIPDGLTVDHLCRVRHCMRRSHMEAVPQSVNWARGTFAERRAEYHESRRQIRYCKRGHEYTEENTARTNKGYRSCRQCKAAYDRQRGKRPTPIRSAEYRARQAEAARRRYRSQIKPDRAA